MAALLSKRKRTKYVLKWGEPGTLPSGSRYWDTDCGKYRIVASEKMGDIALPRVYKLWELRYFKGVDKASLFNFNECKSWRRALKLCEQRNADKAE